MILLDSSVLIASERGQLHLDAFLNAHAKDYFAISAISASELLHGVHRAAPAQRAAREAFVEQLLARLMVFPFDLIAARVHAGLWAQLAAQGTPIGAHDLLIGATALAAGAQLATRDVRSFPNIPGLKIISV